MSRFTDRTLLRVSELEDRSTPAVNGFNVFGAANGDAPIVTVARTDGRVLAQVLAYDTTFRGGVSAALGEIDGNPNTIELVTGAGPGGGPHVRQWRYDLSFANPNPQPVLERDFFAFDPAFTGGVFVG